LPSGNGRRDGHDHGRDPPSREHDRAPHEEIDCDVGEALLQSGYELGYWWVGHVHENDHDLLQMVSLFSSSLTIDY